MHKHNQKRKGVILLIVLGMLAMFGLIGVTFVLLSGHARRSATAQAKVGQANNPPDRQGNNVIMQILRGTNDPASVLRSHSLLEDLYGNGYAEGQFNAAPAAYVGNQIMSVMAIATGTNPIAAPYEQYVGRVLTMTSGNATGKSTRIVGFVAATGFQILRFDSPTQPANGDNFIINGTPFSGTGFGYNPAATGANPLLTATDPRTGVNPNGADGQDAQFALLPNPQPFTPTGTYTDPAGPGGANEDYDAADYQNMLLASLVPQGGGVTIPIPSLHRPSLVNYWFHQLIPLLGTTWPNEAITNEEKWRAFINPEIRVNMQGLTPLAPGNVNQPWTWASPADRLAFQTIIANYKRRIIFRPIIDDHPDFTGSNSDPNVMGMYINAAGAVVPTYNWDVDNDGDGIADSIWVDAGLPVRTMRDGRQYKPLVAILCTDMDGRLNLNAHGCLAQAAYQWDAATLSTISTNPPDTGIYDTAGNPLMIAAGGTFNLTAFPHGQGIGPAEINLWGAGILSKDEYRNLLRGITNPSTTHGRYGQVPAADYTLPLVGSINQATGINPLSTNKWFDYPATYDNSSAAGTRSYGTPLDLQGSVVVGLDLRGQPLYQSTNALNTDITISNMNPVDTADGSPQRRAWRLVSNPYDLDLSDVGRGVTPAHASDSPFMVDTPFTPAELETILRPYDSDNNLLPNRLTTLAPGLATTPERRFEVTTESWSLPCPAVVMPPELHANASVQTWFQPQSNKANNLADLLRARLVEANPAIFTDPTNAAQVNQLNIMVNYLASPELLSDLKLDLNRPFGNGWDDDGNNVVDEPGRVVAGGSGFVLDGIFHGETTDASGVQEGMKQVNSAGGALSGISINHCIGVDVNQDGTVNNADRAMARQLLARYLFTMMMALRDQGYVQPPVGAEPLTPVQQDELTVRRIAQWAINVVDFRDADAIMTPFEYDAEPFVDNSTPPDGNPWDVDGVIGAGSTDDTASHRRLVWGCERPELLLTETLAFHDRRVADTAFDDGPSSKLGTGPGSDPDFDQTRIPQGSAFFELYCTGYGSENNAISPGSLYQYNNTTGTWMIDLSRLAPAETSSPTLRYPVWRLAISESIPGDANNDLRARQQANPSSVSMEPEQFSSELNTTGRSTLLHNPAGDLNIQIERIVWFSTQAPTTNHDDYDRIYYKRTGSSYLNPGEYALIGPRNVTNIGAITTTLGQPSQHTIRLNPVGVVDNDGTNNYPNTASEIKPAIGIVVAGEAPAAWANAPTTAPMGIGISVSEPLFSGSYYPEPTRVGRTPGLWDAYGDLDQVDTTARFGDHPEDSQPGTPLESDGLLARGTTPNYKTVFLQRLANPLEPYHRDRNPYLTVDWSPIDLTVFNGESSATNDPDDPNPVSKTVQFQTRQRGATAVPPNYNLWSAVSEDPTDTTASGPATNNFRHNLEHTLGYIGSRFQDTSKTPSWRTTTSTPPTPGIYRGDPLEPFPWLAWNNRPFTSQLELMLVPTSHPGRLLSEYTTASGANPYNAGVGIPAFGIPFGSLANLFNSSNVANGSPELHRLLEFIRVPSPFVGTELQGNPVTFSGGTHNFQPPFNRISKRRDPGRVNLNTITSENVWNGVRGSFPTPLWNDLNVSRGGFPGANMLTMDNNLPTRFANPFRSFAGLYNIPNVPPLQAAVGSEVNATFLRVDPTGNNPIFRFASTSPINGTDRNPYFRYQLLNRLGSTATNRSNVYAVWVTVGYFEVEPTTWVDAGGGVDARGLTQAQFQKIYPDGFQLGQELGSDTGDITRHRSFYIIDRSIPVGFQRGEDHNVKDAILLHRFIE
ncbi:MAG: hypothetical protein JXM70_25850 [Pirellulales bacterium]|nr:hypothetical protein [Pirellulales bacterium]